MRRRTTRLPRCVKTSRYRYGKDFHRKGEARSSATTYDREVARRVWDLIVKSTESNGTRARAPSVLDVTVLFYGHSETCFRQAGVHPSGWRLHTATYSPLAGVHLGRNVWIAQYTCTSTKSTLRELPSAITARRGCEHPCFPTSIGAAARPRRLQTGRHRGQCVRGSSLCHPPWRTHRVGSGHQGRISRHSQRAARHFLGRFWRRAVGRGYRAPDFRILI